MHTHFKKKKTIAACTLTHTHTHRGISVMVLIRFGLQLREGKKADYCWPPLWPSNTLSEIIVEGDDFKVTTTFEERRCAEEGV